MTMPTICLRLVLLCLLLSGCAASATAVLTQVQGREVLREDGFSQAASETEPLPAETEAEAAEMRDIPVDAAPDSTQQDALLPTPGMENEVVEPPEADASPTPDTRKEPK